MNLLSKLLLFVLLSLPVFSESAYVKRVVDGDTLALRDGRKIRLIGIDTPELHESQKLEKDAARLHEDKRTIQKLGKRASDFTRKLVQSEKVELEYGQEKTDKYGRTLAYVWFDCGKPPSEYLQYLKAKGETWHPQKLMLNRVLIQCGYANAYTRFPFEYMEEFRDCEHTARENDLGLWGPVEGLQQSEEPKAKSKPKEETPKKQDLPDAPFLASKNSTVYHVAGCLHIGTIKPGNLIPFTSEEEAIASGRHKCKG